MSELDANSAGGPEYRPERGPESEPGHEEDSVLAAVRPSRLRRFFLRHLPLSIAVLATLTIVALVGAYFVASSARFEELVRQRLAAELERASGGRVEIAGFHWRLLALEADADGVVIHGLEDAGEEPYARIKHLRVRVSLLNWMAPQLLLRDLEVEQPSFHLIVYPDGSTNQPHPRKRERSNRSAIDTLFRVKAGHIEVERGMAHYEDRASPFDYQDRYIPLDLKADDVSVLLRYVPAGQAAGVSVESYRIEAGAKDLALTRGAGKSVIPAVHGYFQATVDLTRTGAYLRLLRLATRSHEGKDHALEITGVVEDFARPRWQTKTRGELDMRLLESLTGYPYLPEGLARLDLAAAGSAGVFRVDGAVHIENGSYIGTGVTAKGVELDAHVHADPADLSVTSIAARVSGGGQMEGMVNLHPWLPALPGAAELEAATPAHTGNRNIAPPPSPPWQIAMNGKVTAKIENMPLDTLLEMVSAPAYQHLGLDALLNGTADATWTNGDAKTVAVNTELSLSPTGHGLKGEVPANGTIDGTYTHGDGAVELRQLEVRTPGSTIEAHGHVGAYPVTSPTNLALEVHTRNLGEFDTALRSLGLHREGREGTAALPVSLSGEADLEHGSWTGSLAAPRLAGTVTASGLAVELTGTDAHGQRRMAQMDTVEATGSYSAARIEIGQAMIRRGGSEVDLKMTLEAERDETEALAGVRRRSATPEFDSNSVLHLRAQAKKVNLDELRPLVSGELPAEGSIDAQAEVDGPIHALGGTGWVEMDDGKVYGEPVARLRVQGTAAGEQLKLSSVNAALGGGTLSGSGGYDLKSGQFEVNASGTGIDTARLSWPGQHGLSAAGKLGFTLTGAGTRGDPRLKGRATLSGFALGGVQLGGMELTAEAANHAVSYDAMTRLEGAELRIRGTTQLDSDATTQAKAEFSRFNIGSLLKQAQIEGLGGESSLAGTATVEGPLKKPDALRGEAKLEELAVTISGVHLASRGGLHATLANGRIQLDPVHIIGEDTDMRAQGSVTLNGTQRLDAAASGSINLKLAETLDPDLTANGMTTFQMEAHGPLRNPDIEGRIDFQNSSLSLGDIPNGLSQLHGTLEYSQNRLVVKSLTAMSGGGLVSVGGYLSYQHGIYADLTVSGKGIRIRYPPGVSSQADATLRLQGAQNNLLLSGDVQITRFTMSQDLDIASLAAEASGTQTLAPANAPSNHVRLDVHVTSSPQLNFQNAYAKLAGDVDLHLRGTLASPALLGRVSITEGSAIIAGTRYELQSGDVVFTNPVRIEPMIDLTATAYVEDYNITLGLHGTPQSMAVSYRSDPPMPEADVVALLALGRTENQQRLYTQQQEQTGTNVTTDALLGGALNATVSSRVQKLFGAGSVKVDPNYLGALGNSTSRIIVEEQLGRNLTLTYATNVNTTGQQLIQAEVAINRHVSLLVARDESGVFSMVLKATRRYR